MRIRGTRGKHKRMEAGNEMKRANTDSWKKGAKPLNTWKKYNLSKIIFFGLA